ncbi:MAG TPA: hypothetical protein VNZ57_05245 [Longimicrobiales bacterium]|nr:hypothetical protein [Longimicrobiales bacterium]
MASLIAVLVAATFGQLFAQTEVVVEGRGDPELDRRLRNVIAAPGLRVIAEDTLFAEGDTLAGPVLVAGATVFVEGVIAGDLIGVDANVFLRPTARITGDAINIAGGLYRSELAGITGSIVDRPTAAYEVRREAGRVRIVGMVVTSPWTLHGFRGFHAPTYDRVDGLTVRWGATYAFPLAAGATGAVDATVAIRTARWAPAGSVEVQARMPATTLAAGAERESRTNETWVRDPLTNSVAYLLAGRDYRDYYESDRIYLRLGHGWRGATYEGSVAARVMREWDRSLGARDPWTLFGGGARSNPGIDDGRIDAIVASGAFEWTGNRSRFATGVEVEAGSPRDADDGGFGRFQLGGSLGVATFGEQRLDLLCRFQGPLPGTDRLPRQRWSFVGGYGTLPTFPIGHFRGDRLVFVESRYVVPLTGLRIPLVGTPDLHLIHAAGSAWTAADPDDDVAVDSTPGSRRLEQNLGVELRSWAPFVGVVVDPRKGVRDATAYVGFTLPVPRAAWE